MIGRRGFLASLLALVAPKPRAVKPVSIAHIVTAPNIPVWKVSAD